MTPTRSLLARKSIHLAQSRGHRVIDLVRFLSLLFVALALVPAGAHLMELARKIGLPAQEYLTVQKLYRGWNRAAVVVVGALLSTFALAVVLREEAAAFFWSLLALACVIGTQGVFWMFTYPVNRATANWTQLPADWQQLRRRWEYSHAASAVLNLAALVSTILAVVLSGKAATAA
jgi:hypothetical protein